MGIAFHAIGWLIAAIAGFNALITGPLVVTVQQQTVFWIQIVVMVLGLLLAALGGLATKHR